MQDGDQAPPRSASYSSNPAVLATTLATLILATGSAFLWRSRSSGHNSIVGGAEPANPALAGLHALKGKGRADDVSAHDGDTREGKNPRSKERRRRGKDPMKELMKGGKKNKVLAKPTRAVFVTENSGDTTPTPLPNIIEPVANDPHPSRATSMEPSSRSVSTASSRSGRNSSSVTESTHGPHPPDGNSTSRHESDTDKVMHPSASAISSASNPNATLGDPESGSSEVDSSTSHDHGDATFSLTQNVSSVLPSSFPSTSASVSDDGSSGRSSKQLTVEDVLETSAGAHSDHIPASDKGGTPNISISHSVPTYVGGELNSPVIGISSLSQPSHEMSGPWDWDGQTSAAATDCRAYRKPPRFSRPSSRSTSPMAMTASVSMPHPFSNHPPILAPSVEPLATCSELTPSTSGLDEAGVPDAPFSFPTLNPPPTSTTVPSLNSDDSPTPSAMVNGNGSMHGNNNGHSRTPRNGHIPRRAPTPSSQSSTPNTPPPSLSAQTQIASLRGALEAARLREDKVRLEMEKHLKELETVRWESVAWRQREAELQNQILHLTHHLQAYTAMFASMSPPPHSHAPSPHHLPIPSSNSKSQHYPTSNSPSPTPPRSQLSPPANVQTLMVNGLLSPPTALSPLTPPGSHPHLFGYPPIPHPHMQNPTQPPPPSGMYPMYYPITGTNGSNTATGSSGATGTASAGSLSPDLGASPTSAVPSFVRGRPRTRPQNPFWNGSSTAGTEDGWIEVADASGADEEVSEVLADAILKRPESLRGSSKPVEGADVEQPTEFTFPSLSDLGNVDRSGGKLHVQGAGPEYVEVNNEVVRVGSLETSDSQGAQDESVDHESSTSVIPGDQTASVEDKIDSQPGG